MDDPFRIRILLAPILAMLLAISGCVTTVVEDYTKFHSNSFSPREQPAEVFTGTTEELLSSDYLLIGYVDFTHNALSCYEDYTCSNDEKSHMTTDFLRDRSAFRGADRIQIIDSELTLKPATKSVCTSTRLVASYVEGVLVTTTVCNSYKDYPGYTESWQKRALLWRHEPELATAEMNYAAVRKALPKLAAAETSDTETETAANPFARLFEEQPDSSSETDVYGEKLIVAIRADNIEYLQNELGSDALAAFEQSQQTSLLALAYQLERPPVYRWLIEQDTNWATTPARHGVLEYAIVFSSPADVARLLERHAYLERQWSPPDRIYLALASARNVEMLDYVLERGFSPDAVFEDNYSMLQLAIDVDNPGMARALIERGASVRPLTENMLPPLMAAIRQNQPELMDLLLDRGASVMDTDEQGNSAIHFAAAFGNPDVIPGLLARGIDINLRNTAGLSPIYLSILARNWPMSESLMQWDIDYRIPDFEHFVVAVKQLLYEAPASTLSMFLEKTRLLRFADLEEMIVDMAVGCAKFCSEASMTVLLEQGINANFVGRETSLFEYAHTEANEAAMIALIKHGYRDYSETSALSSLQYALIEGDTLRVKAYRLAGDASGAEEDPGTGN